mmetsp:Transcript_31324/g.68463  ORF Transcript_31324/g.68463 Transcript_31324/m.68463 type:complete len:213 (+) Transcript_31324:893-1531(+)
MPSRRFYFSSLSRHAFQCVDCLQTALLEGVVHDIHTLLSATLVMQNCNAVLLDVAARTSRRSIILVRRYQEDLVALIVSLHDNTVYLVLQCRLRNDGLVADGFRVGILVACESKLPPPRGRRVLLPILQHQGQPRGGLRGAVLVHHLQPPLHGLVVVAARRQAVVKVLVLIEDVQHVPDDDDVGVEQNDVLFVASLVRSVHERFVSLHPFVH